MDAMNDTLADLYKRLNAEMSNDVDYWTKINEGEANETIAERSPPENLAALLYDMHSRVENESVPIDY